VLVHLGRSALLCEYDHRNDRVYFRYNAKAKVKAREVLAADKIHEADSPFLPPKITDELPSMVVKRQRRNF
jgi:hypothetical protein